jgi:hypothetical protein
VSEVVGRLLHAPYGHTIRRDKQGNSHVSLYQLDGTLMHTIVAPTFDEAATRALDLAPGLKAPTQTEMFSALDGEAA